MFWYRHPKHENREYRMWRLKRISDAAEAEDEYNAYLEDDFDVALYNGELPVKKRVVQKRPNRKHRNFR